MYIKLEFISGPSQGQIFRLEAGSYFLVGSGYDTHISIVDDIHISRHHFLFYVFPKKCKIIDLDSKNGTFVNGVRYGGRMAPDLGICLPFAQKKQCEIADGDIIRVGYTMITVSVKNGSTGKFVLKSPSSHCESCKKPFLEVERSKTKNICTNCSDRKKLACILETIKHEDYDPLEMQPMENIGCYSLKNLIGRSTNHVMYQAQEIHTNKNVVVKILLPRILAFGRQFLYGFKTKVDIDKQLKHPNIVKTLDWGYAKGVFYLVSEFIPGIDLEKLLHMSPPKSFMIGEAVSIILEVLDGLAYAHQTEFIVDVAGKKRRFTGVTHQDIKPQNIILQKCDGKYQPKITDLGLSKFLDSSEFLKINKFSHTNSNPLYWPREQVFGATGPHTDVFSSAAVLYKLLTGRWVRNGFEKMFLQCQKRNQTPDLPNYLQVIIENPVIPIEERRPDIPTKLAQIINRALYEHRSEGDSIFQNRYPNAYFFRRALNSWVTS